MKSGKPSALKGSPSSRKGHRRQNCVRISLSPIVINTHKPSPSPSMVSIQEESPDIGTQVEKPATGYALSNAKALPRPPSSSTFAPEVKLSPTILRASLTPDSPTLSLVGYSQEPSSSDNNWSLTASPSKLHRRSDSNCSMLVIPTFPSPEKATTNPVVPTPTFSFSRPSSEFDEQCNPPPEFRLLAQPVIPSRSSFPGKPQSTNLVTSSLPNETDLTLSQLHDDQLERSQELANVVQNKQEAVGVGPSKLLPKWPFAGSGTQQNNIECPIDSPPCSPKSQPTHSIVTTNKNPNVDLAELTQFTMHTEGIATARPEVTETGENGGQVPPPTLTTKRTITPTHATTTATTTSSSSSFSSSSHEVPPSPLRYSIAQLRRMNSDASQDSLGARRYLKLGREASMSALDVDTMLAGGRCRWDSWITIPEPPFEEDAEMADETQKEVELGETSQGEEVYGEMQRREDLEELSMDMEMLERMSDNLRLGVASHKEMQSEVSTSVCVDGKNHSPCEKEGVAQEGSDSRLPMADSSGNRGRIEHPRIIQLRSDALEGQKASNNGQETPLVKVQPPSANASPGSLYDENGFLRC